MAIYENKGKLFNEVSYLDFLILLAAGLFFLALRVYHK